MCMQACACVCMCVHACICVEIRRQWDDFFHDLLCFLRKGLSQNMEFPNPARLDEPQAPGLFLSCV